MTTGPGADRGALKLEAIVLAAGFGARFGGGKLVAPWKGGALIDGALAAAFAAPVRSVTVVTGADPAVAPAAEAFAAKAGETARLHILYAPEHAEGMGASLRTGISLLPGDTEGAFVFLGDMPQVPVSVLPKLAEAIAGGAAAAAPVFDGQRGHPVLFSAALFEPMRALTGDAGARHVLAGLGDAFVTVPAETDGILFDIDRREQLP
jgi:molybdenum cofactor cytidylyltransferase